MKFLFIAILDLLSLRCHSLLSNWRGKVTDKNIQVSESKLQRRDVGAWPPMFLLWLAAGAWEGWLIPVEAHRHQLSADEAQIPEVDVAVMEQHR